MSHRALLRLSALAAVLLLGGCADYGDTREPGDVVGEVASVAASPTVSPTPSPTEEPPAGGEDASDEEAGDQPEAAGNCAAYANSGSWCTNGIGDYDCEGGSGNGPNYAPEGARVRQPGVDPFGLDRDDDGTGCEKAAAPPPPEPAPEPEPDTDPRFNTCGEAKAAGYGPYHRGSDPEYDWYRDSDSDGVVCE